MSDTRYNEALSSKFFQQLPQDGLNNHLDQGEQILDNNSSPVISLLS